MRMLASPEALDQIRELGPLVNQDAPAHEAAERGQRDIAAHREREEQGLLLAILGHEADAGADRLAGERIATLPDRRSDAAALERVGAENGARARSAAHEAGDREDFATAHRQIHAMEDRSVQALPRAAPAGFRDFQHHGTWLARLEHGANSATERPIIMPMRSSTERLSATARGPCDQPAVAQHRRPVAETDHLVEPMGDEDDAQP